MNPLINIPVGGKGVRTSEFALGILGSIAGAIMFKEGMHAADVLTTLSPVLAYVGGRPLVKMAQAFKLGTQAGQGLRSGIESDGSGSGQ